MVISLTFFNNENLLTSEKKEISPPQGFYFYKKIEKRDQKVIVEVEELIHFSFIKKNGEFNIIFYRAGDLYRFYSVRLDCVSNPPFCKVVEKKGKKLFIEFKVLNSNEIMLTFVTKDNNGEDIFFVNSVFTNDYKPSGTYNYSDL